MRKAYICSPYRAKDSAELDRHIDYAQALTRLALEAGVAPITPHLYMTQCLDESKEQERAQGMAAGLALLKSCDFVIVGVKYGICCWDIVSRKGKKKMQLFYSEYMESRECGKARREHEKL